MELRDKQARNAKKSVMEQEYDRVYCVIERDQHDAKSLKEQLSTTICTTFDIELEPNKSSEYGFD